MDRQEYLGSVPSLNTADHERVASDRSNDWPFALIALALGGLIGYSQLRLGEAADVLEAMARDKDCFVVMTLAGAMTVAKQGLIVADLIDRGIVNAIVSTGALMAHGLVEATGRAHFRHNPEVSDEELYEQGYNRVYDTLEPEQNLDDVEEVMSAVLESWDHNEVMCSYKLGASLVLSGLFFVAGGLKIVYDLLLLRSFRRVRPPEEAGRQEK